MSVRNIAWKRAFSTYRPAPNWGVILLLGLIVVGMVIIGLLGAPWVVNHYIKPPMHSVFYNK